MATEIDLTGGVQRALTATANNAQLIAQSVDVSKHDQADLILHVAGVEGNVTNFTMSITSGMQMESDDGWVTLGSFSSVTTPNGTAVLHLTGLFKFIRWRVTTMTGGTAVTFTIRGMARGN